MTIRNPTDCQAVKSKRKLFYDQNLWGYGWRCNNIELTETDGSVAHVLVVVGGRGSGVSVSNEVVVATITEYISVGIEVLHNFH